MAKRASKSAQGWEAVNQRLIATDPGSLPSLRDAIAWLYAAMDSIPDRLLQDFEAFSEAMLDAGAEARARAVGEGQVAVATGLPPVDALLDAARLLRALEDHFIELCPSLAVETGEELEARCTTSDGRHYVLPRVTPLAGTVGKPFRRRALRHCRVLPVEIGGFRVRLHRLSGVADATERESLAAGGPRSFGAALFPGLTAKLATGPEKFTVASLGGFDAAARIGEQLDAAHDAGCWAVVWPELTMPETSVQLVRARIASHILERGTRHRFLVAGSWHRELAGGRRNGAQVLDGRGAPLFHVFKWAKFAYGSLREGIVPGEEIHVLVTEDELIVFAICRDFLQETSDVPYRNMPVDLAIVPSMTGKMPDPDTLGGHAATAQAMRVRYGTRTLVVAQPFEADGSDNVGEVLAFPARPLRDGAETVRDTLHLCDLETR